MPGRLYNATYGRLFAAGYDLYLRGVERAGLAERRASLLARATGATIEIGAGTGLNLDCYPPSVSELVLTEPGEHMVNRLRRRAASSGRNAEVVVAAGERLPFEDEHFDTAVATIMLCTATDPDAVLEEIARVLKPGGQLLFIEHVRSDSARLARWQDRLHGPWYYINDGCNCNRDTLATIEASPLRVAEVEHDQLPEMLLARPILIGAAAKPSPG
jgi:ubiquinone/menaquinone biosynthesis C-methylase UbiE